MDKKNNDKLVTEKKAKTKKNPLVFIGSVLLLVVITITFVFSGFGSTGSVESIEFGKYNGEAIIYDENFLNTVEYYMQQMEMYGQQSDMFSAMSRAFQDAVLSLAFIDEVEKSGYFVPDSQLNRDMIQYYTDDDGKYSEVLFQKTPESTRIEIKNATNDMAMRNTYAEDISTAKVSSKEVAFIESMNEKQRSFNLVSFNTAAFPEEEIIKFGTENADLFASYNMDIITLNDEAEAKNVLARITNKEITFADAIAEFSIDQYSGEDGNLNNSLHYELENIIVDESDFNTLIGLAAGTMSEVVETSTGYSIFSVKSAPVKAVFPNATLTQVVKEYLTVFETGLIEEYFINLAKDFVSTAVGYDYNTAVDAFELTNAVVEDFPINYGNAPILEPMATSTVPQLAQAQSSEKFFETAFSLGAGDYSEPIVLGSDIIILSNAEEVVVPAVEGQISSMYDYYISVFDSTDVTANFMASDKLENNLFATIIENFL